MSEQPTDGRSPRCRLGGYEIDEDRGELLGAGGERIPLQPKVLDVLLLLVRNRDRLLTRDEILETVWNDVRVSEASLFRCISVIRRVLGNDAIETRRGRGYRLVATVEIARAEAPSAPTASGRRARRVGLACGLAAAVLAALVWLGRPFAVLDVPTPAASFGLARDIAVLPLAPVGGLDPGTGRRIALEIADRLAVATELRVVSPAASFPLAGGRSPTEIGRALSVGTLVLGNLRPAGAGVRATVEIVDARSGLRTWSRSFDFAEAKRAPVDAVAERVARVLGASSAGVVRYVSEQDELEAARYYLTGRDAVSESKREHLIRALALFERAVELDPDQARAHTGLAIAYERLWGLDEDGALWLDRGEASARRALALAPDDPEVLAVLATLRRDRRDWSGALAGYRAAVAAGPSARAHDALARLLCMLGRLDEASYHSSRALALAPGVGSFHFTRARVDYYLGRPQHALAHLERAMALDPTLLDMPTLLARVHAAAGNPGRAQEAFLLVVAPWFRPFLRGVDRVFGTRASLRLVLWMDAVREGTRCPTGGMGRALIWARLGETERMFECLAATAEKHPWYAAVEPGFVPWHDDRRFRAILERQGLAVRIARQTPERDTEPLVVRQTAL